MENTRTYIASKHDDKEILLLLYRVKTHRYIGEEYRFLW